MPKKILGLTGPIASGKGTVRKYVENKYGGKYFRFSSIIRDILIRIGQETSRSNMAKVSVALRNEFGQNILSKVIAEDIKKADNDIIVLDGIRRISDIEYLKDLPGFILVKIDADPKIRYERMVRRNENAGDREKTFEQFMKDHENGADNELPTVMAKATKFLDGNGNLENLFKQIDQIINS